MSEKKLMCPSARCQEGALLVGIIMSDGRVAFSADKMPVTGEFVKRARLGRTPEKRFRFGDTCLKKGCRQWTGDRCGVVDSVMEIGPSQPVAAEDLPPCSIRAECRWFHQAGAEACAVCPEVITDLRVEDIV